MARLISLEDLAPTLKRHDRLMGLDLGTKTIGLALSDLERSIATPHKIIQRRKFTLDAADLLAVAAEYNVVSLVIGLPLNMDGSEGPRVQSTRAFIRSLSPLTDLACILWDERLSTVAAERMLIAQDMSRAKRKSVIDSTAAAYFLQGALDRLAHIRRASEA
ncbi:MAG: Holliday junction resolvase RuvX [Beijerinckiaceae bacterium]|nr:Holliday junction resolvase RuvX [Beijerinckiaceae bacterium]